MDINGVINEKKKIIILSGILLVYLIFVIIFVVSIGKMGTHTQKFQKDYLEKAQETIETTIGESQTEKTIVEGLEKVVQEFPMELVLRNDKNILLETLGARENELRDKAKNGSVVLAYEQVVFELQGNNYQLTYNLFQPEASTYMAANAKTQTYIILGCMFILFFFLAIIQYYLYSPLRLAKKNLENLEKYELSEVIEMETPDAVNMKIQKVAENLNENISNISTEFTELEQALQIEKEKLEKAHVISRAFVHDLKTPLHQTLVENETALMYGTNLTSEVDAVLKYNINQSSKILKTINQILEVMDEKEYDVHKEEQVDFSEMLLTASKNFSSSLRKRDVYLSIDVPENEIIETNGSTLRLLVHNVISNAVQYAQKETEIEISLDMDETYIIFSCTNTASDDDIKRMRAEESLFKVHVNNEFSSGKGLFLIKELTQFLAGIYELKIDNNQVTVEIKLNK